jgi:GT2 family glycosyltransferase
LNHFRTAVVIVTYGDRGKLLGALLARLGQMRGAVERVFIVDNASAYDVEAAIPESLIGRVRIVVSSANIGSAGGYWLGLSHACSDSDADFLWLLDDDNLPSANALRHLIELWKGQMTGGPTVVCACRKDRKMQVVSALPEEDRSAVESQFLGFDLPTWLSRRARRIWKPRVAPGLAELVGRPLQLSVAPYGGLLIPRDIVDQVGLPLKELCLYQDDHEYSRRMRRAGVRILLCNEAQIEDLESSWDQGRSAPRPVFDLNTPNKRIYFTVRNKIYLADQVGRRSRYRYGLNKCVFLISLLMYQLVVYRRPFKSIRRMRLIVEAVRDGEMGRLGCERL